MQTMLDEGHTWFLESLKYEDGLTIWLIEGVRSDKPEDLMVGGSVIKNTYAVEPTGSSKRAVVRFGVPVAWQVVDESYTSWDDTEERDDKSFLQVLTRSTYLDYVNENHGWYKDVAGPASHYRLWTADEVIDVVAPEAPVVSNS